MKPTYGRLMKLGTLKDPYHPKSDHRIDVQQFMDGGYMSPPTIGKPFTVFSFTGVEYLRTSTVKSIYVVGSEYFDKLVLPSSFPEAEKLEMPQELRKGDYLIATLNSVYWFCPDYLQSEQKPKTKKRATKKKAVKKKKKTVTQRNKV